MANDALCWMSAVDLAAAIARKKVSPLEVVDAVLDRIERLKHLNAYCLVDREGARRAARAAERALTGRRPTLGPLHGVPFSVKDLVATKGVRTTFGTPLYRDNVPTEDAPSVARLKAAGAIMLGKTNTPTFGWVGVTDNLLFGPTRNPWNPKVTPGGSSGGAGAAAAAGLGPLHIGTDGGGSIRKPAAWCGIYGLKPSYGRVGLHPHGAAWSLSHAGPMTRTVKDAALMLSVMAGPDERDQYSLPTDGAGYVRALGGGLKGLRVAYSATLGIAPVVDPEIAAATARTARLLREVGCRVETVRPTWPSPYECWRDTFFGGIATRLIPYLDRRSEIDPGLLAIVEEVKGLAADAVRAGVARPSRLVAARAGLLREVRSAALAHGGQPAAAHRRVLRDGDRRQEGGARGRQRLHVPLQHDRPASRHRAVRLHAKRTADRAADRRPPLRRRQRAAGLGGAGTAAPVGGPASAGGLTARSMASASAMSAPPSANSIA